MQTLSDLIMAAMALTSAKGEHIGNWKKFIGLGIMFVLGSVGGVSGALLTMKVQEAVIENRVHTLEVNQMECSKNLRQHETNPDIHAPHR